MYKNNQLWNRFFPISQRISYWYKETPRCPNIYIIDLNKFLLLFLLTITKQKYFSSSCKLLFNYIVFEFTLLLVVRPRYSENYIATISYTWEWTSNFGAVTGSCCVFRGNFWEQSTTGGNSSIGNFVPIFFPYFVFIFLFVFNLFYLIGIHCCMSIWVRTREAD